MSDDGLTYRLYRCPTSTRNASKDWAIAVQSNGHLSVRFGATGKTARLVDIPPGHFSRPTAAEEAGLREQAQLDQGYEYVGDAVMRRGHLEVIPQVVPARSQELDVFWEIKQSIERDALIEALRTTAERLNAGPLTHRVEWDEKRTACRVHTRTRWEIGFTDPGGLTPDGRGGGVVRREQGVLPLLVLIHLQRTFPGALSLVNAKAEPLVATFQADDPVIGANRFAQSEVVPLIGRLGLCPGWIPLPQDGEGSAGLAIWV